MRKNRRLQSIAAGVLALTTAMPVAGFASTARAPFTKFRAPLAASSTTPRAGSPVDAVVADFTGDRELDIVEAISSGGLAFRLGTGHERYADSIALDAAGVNADRVIAADVTCDGLADVIAFRKGGTTLWVLPADGNGGFGAARVVTVPKRINAVALGDFNQDAGTDIAVAFAEGNELGLLIDRDDRAGFTLRTVPVGAPQLSIAPIQLDGTGFTSLAVGLSNKTVVALANHDGEFSAATTRHLEFSPDLMAAGDLNRDGWQDVVAASSLGNFASFARRPGGIGEAVVSSVAAPLYKMSVGFADGDAEADVVAIGDHVTMMFAGIGAGRFAAPRRISGEADAESVTLVTGTGGARSMVLVTRPSGTSIEKVADSAGKLEAVFTVTTTADETYVASCPIPTPPPTPLPPPVLFPAPTGSLRWAIDQANANPGPDTIVFALPITDAHFAVNRFVWFILENGSFRNGGNGPFRLLPGAGDGTSIIGETQTDTNPFGPDIVIQPLDISQLPVTFTPPAVAAESQFTAFEVSGSNCSVSGLIIAGTNFIAVGPSGALNASCMPVDAPYPVAPFFDIAFDLEGANNVIRNNYLGTDERGNAIPAPGAFNLFSRAQILIEGNGNRVGGPALSDKNVITGSVDGIRLVGPTGTTIQGNVIGTDGTLGGTPTSAGLNNIGVSVLSSHNTAISTNTISGNARTGILIDIGTDSTTITNNGIGADRNGAAIAGNSDEGILINAANPNAADQTAGITIGPANNILGNTGPDTTNQAGVSLRGTLPGGPNPNGTPTRKVRIADNKIQGNADSGVIVFFGIGNTIGPNNVISPVPNGNAQKNGVVVVNGVANTISRNSIFGNSRLGIDLVAVPEPDPTGATPNDPGDADSGPNTLLNYPVFTGVRSDGSTVTVFGTAPPGTMVEIFLSVDGDATTRGQGKTYLTTANAATGQFSAVIPVTLPAPDGTFITGTATDGAGNTSEFSPNFPLAGNLDVQVSSIGFDVVSIGMNDTHTFQICNNGPADIPVAATLTNNGGGVFTISSIPEEGQILSPGECTSVSVTFAPTSAGTFVGSLSIQGAAGTPPVILTITGTGSAPAIRVSPTELTIPTTPIGGTGTTTVTVTNVSAGNVSVGPITIHRQVKANGKVRLTSDLDPFFHVDQASFNLGPNQSKVVTVTFTPEIPKKLRDLPSSGPFQLPDPSYILPEVVRDSMDIPVEQGGPASVQIKATVPDDPVLLGGTCRFTSGKNRLVLTLTMFDPDGNYQDVNFKVFNEANVQLFKVDSTPGFAQAAAKFPKGLVITLRFTFKGLAQFFDSLSYIDIQVVDGNGQKSNVGRCQRDTGKVGAPAGPLTDSGSAIEIPEIDLEPPR